jgi:hypothetical protein
MLDQDESHPSAGWQGAQQFPAGLKAPSGCADADDREAPDFGEQSVCWSRWRPYSEVRAMFGHHFFLSVYLIVVGVLGLAPHFVR